MASETPNGAVDNGFEDGKRDPRDILQERLDGFPRDIRGGDIAIDVVQGRPLYVRRRRANSAAEYFDEEDFDLTTYKAHPWLPVSADDPIFECVFLPTKPEGIPSSKGDKTYDYPRGRLARVPVEWLYDSDVRPQYDQKAALVAAMIAKSHGDSHGSNTPGAVEAVARDVFGDDVVDDALSRARIGKS